MKDTFACVAFYPCTEDPVVMGLVKNLQDQSSNKTRCITRFSPHPSFNDSPKYQPFSAQAQQETKKKLPKNPTTAHQD